MKWSVVKIKIDRDKGGNMEKKDLGKEENYRGKKETERNMEVQ